MSGRYTNMATFAYDASGNRYLVTQEYFYNSGSGCYHERIDINDKFYDLEGYVDDEEMTKKGTYLPHTSAADCGSYFTQAPTETIQTVLREAELTEIEITSFLTIVLLSVNAGVYEAVGHRITPEGVTEIEFDIQNATIKWSGDDQLSLRANATAYYTDESSISETTKTIKGGD